MFTGTKGQSVGFAWVYGLITLFGIGIMYIVFNQVFVAHLVPVIKTMANTSLTSGGMSAGSYGEVIGGIDKYMDIFHLLPFILFFVVLLYMIFAAFRSEKVQY